MRVLCCSEDQESPDPGYPIQSGNYTPSKKVRFKGRDQCRRAKAFCQKVSKWTVRGRRRLKRSSL